MFVGVVNQQFYVGPDRFVVRDVFLSFVGNWAGEMMC